MSKALSKRPSPAMIVALVALFVALGGSAYAASKIGTKDIKNNAITTAKIKKNAVTAAKVKKNAITTAKIKDGAVTGTKIDAATLGTVPNASHASTADSATNATNFSRYFTSGLKKASVGQTVPLANVGPFTFTGVCEDLGGNKYRAQVYVTTSAAGSYLYSDEDSYYDGSFGPGDEALASEYTESTSAGWFGSYGYYNEFTAASPTGDVLIEGHANNGVHVFGADCAFALNFVNEA